MADKGDNYCSSGIFVLHDIFVYSKYAVYIWQEAWFDKHFLALQKCFHLKIILIQYKIRMLQFLPQMRSKQNNHTKQESA